MTKRVPLGLLEFTISALVKYCLKKGLKIHQVDHLIKKEFVFQARDSISEWSVASISLATGIYRKEVKDLLSEKNEAKPYLGDLVTRAVGMWLAKKPYCSKIGNPLPLTYAGGKSKLAQLCNEVSKELNFYTLLKELERTKMIDYDGEKVLLKSHEYIPQEDVAHAGKILENDLSSLLSTVESNISGNEQNLHLSTSFDNLSLEHLSLLKKKIIALGADFHKELREELSRFDLDYTTILNQKGGGKISVTTFSFSPNSEESNSEEPSSEKPNSIK
jgi:hypothetical protein